MGKTYQTDPALLKPNFWRRQFPSLGFYRHILRIVLSASAKARKGQYTDEEWLKSSWENVHAVESGGCSVTFEGLEVLEQLDAPAVFVGNHMSTAETILLAAWWLPQRRITFVVKKALVEMPIFGPIMRSREPVVVGREDPREDLRSVMEEGQDRLKKGYDVIVFPQRTRTVKFQPEEFNTIGVKLARKAYAYAVPLALKTDAWSNGKWIKDFGPFRAERNMHFAIGEPMKVTTNGRMENQLVIDFIQKKLLEWQD